MLYREEIHEYVQSNRADIIHTLKELIKIPSVRGQAEENAPFGKECSRVLDFTQQLYEGNGFKTKLDTQGGYLLSYYGEGEEDLGIFAHADVVQASDDWIYTAPFEPLEKDGCIIGRGAWDDKAAIVISLYCAKILRELAIPLHSRLVLFTGSNEESGMQDIKTYVANHTPPAVSLVADSGFPAYRGDKGVLRFWATSLIPLKEIKGFSGGEATNVTLGKAEAWFRNELFVAEGISQHAALPEGSVNAAYLLAKQFSNNPAVCEEDREQMRFVAETLADYYGEAFGVENDDPDFGKLTCTNGIAATNDQKLSLSFNMRYGMGVDIEEVKYRLQGYFEKAGWSVEFVSQEKPFCVVADNPYLLACLDTYKVFTGCPSAKAYINAGGTYAVHLPCAIEIGTTLDQSRGFDLPKGHGNVHQPDEYINVDGLLGALELTVLMLIEVDAQLNKRRES